MTAALCTLISQPLHAFSGFVRFHFHYLLLLLPCLWRLGLRPPAYEMVGAAEATFFRAPWRNATYLCPGSGIEDHVGLGCEFSKPVSSRLLDFDADLRVWQLITQLADAL